MYKTKFHFYLNNYQCLPIDFLLRYSKHKHLIALNEELGILSISNLKLDSFFSFVKVKRSVGQIIFSYCK